MTERGKRGIDIRLSRVGGFKLVAEFLVSPFRVYPSQHDHWIRRSTSGEGCFVVLNGAGGE